MPGILYVVATPIGNLEDLSARAARLLGSVSLIAAEDTRRSARLLSHLGLRRPMISYHDHSAESRAERILETLAAGEDVALVSDAGTPLISDPGFELVRAARERGITVIPVPGPSAVLAALSVAGLATDQFSFRGFPPAKSAARRAWLEPLALLVETQVFMESAHRIGPSVDAMAAVFGAERSAFIGREMSKLHEQYVAATLGELARQLDTGTIPARGELVIVVAGAEAADASSGETEARRLLVALLEELPASRAARVAARLTDVPRQRCFELAQGLRTNKP